MSTSKPCDKRIAFLSAAAVVGFGLLQGARLLDLDSGPYSPHPYALVGLASDGIAFLVVAALSYAGRIERPGPLCAIALASALAYAALTALGSTADAALVLRQITAGMGWSLSILCWMHVFARYPPRRSLVMIALSYTVDVAIQLPIGILFPNDRLLALAVVFSLSSAALLCCLANDGFVAERMRSDAVPQTSMAEALSRTKRAVANAFLFSLICGFVIETDIFHGLQYAQTDLAAALGIGVSLLMLGVVLKTNARKANLDYLGPIAALCLVSVLLYRSLDGANGYVAGALMTTFLVSFYVLLWLMFVGEAHERKLPAFFLLGIALGTARLSVAIGRFLAGDLLERGLLDPRAAIIASAWLLTAGLSFIFLDYLRFSTRMNDRAERENEGSGGLAAGAPGVPEVSRASGAADATGADSDAGPCAAPRSDLAGPLGACAPAHVPVDAARELLKRTFRLSERECEIIGEYAAGRSARHIADRLVLSEHTVKTHLRHAYAKMDVHSRQELLDLVELLALQHDGAQDR